MLPPVAPAVLARNPNFEILYKDICTRKFNPDGSTRDTKKQRIHDDIGRSLNTSLKTLHSNTILLQTLSTLSSKSATLPPELHLIVDLATTLLTDNLTASDRAFLDADMELFADSLPTICAALSDQLIKACTLLGKIADQDSRKSSDTKCNTPELPISELSQRVREVSDQATRALPQELGEARNETAQLAYKTLDLHRRVLEASIRVLEQTMYGSVARSTRARAEAVGVRSMEVGARARIHTLQHPPPAPLLAALQNYQASQSSTSTSLQDRQALAEKALELYDKAGSKGMGDLARRAKWLKWEIARMEDEIVGLEEGV